MNARPKPYVTVEQYLAIERVAIEKSEYYEGEMFLMAGAKERHNTIAFNIGFELGVCFRKRGSRVYGSDMRLYTKTTGLFSYADAVVICGKPELHDEKLDILTNPLVIVEVLSKSTEKYDRGRKFELYKGLSSFQHYLLIAQKEPLVEHFHKQESGEWRKRVFTGLDATLHIAQFELSVPLSELYLNVDFSVAEK
jgi:Uma2 family endonuclease